MEELLFKAETFQIIGAAMRVHQTLGCGFTEKVYQDAIEIEFQNQSIPYVREHSFHVTYNGTKLKAEFIPDFVCFDNIIVELKATKDVEDIHRSQAINYGRVAGMPIA